MKTTDIEKIHEAGLISAEPRDQIIAHFGLKEDGGKNIGCSLNHHHQKL